MTTDWLDDGKGFRCNGCGAEETYAPSEGFFLLAWLAAGEAFDELHGAQCARLADQVRTTGSDEHEPA